MNWYAIMRNCCAAAVLMLTLATAHGELRVERLMCENEAEPLGIDVARPHLAWMLTSDVRSGAQGAYRVLVATTVEKLGHDEGNAWDSGEVKGSAQNQIEYAGAALEPGADYWWKVMVWDAKGQPSAWSQPAKWTTGLQANDWKGKWITAPFPSYDMTLRRVGWIWFKPAAIAGAPDKGVRYFTFKFTAPKVGDIATANVVFAAGQSGEAWLNGERVTSFTWPRVARADVKQLLRDGENMLAVRADGNGAEANVLGMGGRLRIDLKDGERMDYVTSTSWQVSMNEYGDEWKRTGLSNGFAAQGMSDSRRTPRNSRWVLPEAPLPIFRKEFAVDKQVKRALVFVSGLGHYDLFLNGAKVGNHILDPASSEYGETVYYNTFDVTKELQQGKNAFGVMLGKGFFNSTGDRRIYNTSNDFQLRMILQAEVEYDDGTRQTIESDESWKAAPGPVTHAAIMGGSDYDARLVQEGWARPGFDDAQWANAVGSGLPREKGTAHAAQLLAALGNPLTVHQIFKPKSVDQPEPGVFVYDFGQNAASIPIVKVKGQAGQKIRLSPAEQRSGAAARTNNGKGRVNPASIGLPHYYEYTLRGGEGEGWMPQFAYCGYQYIELTGAVPAGEPNPDNLPVVESIESAHVRASAPVAGAIKFSKQPYNDIFRIIDWSVKNNMWHVLTDCPHREKLGWLEQSYLMATGIFRTYDMSRYYAKFEKDIADSQAEDGEIFTVAPHYAKFGGGYGYSPEWGAAGVHIPWLLFRYYGDQPTLAARFESMKGYVDYMEETSTDLIAKAGLGDWYDYGHGKPNGASQFTPKELTATTTFLECTNIVTSAALVLGKDKDAAHYRDLAKRIREKLNATWFDGEKEYKNTGSNQCANAMAIVAGAVPSDKYAAVVQAIVDDLEKWKYQQTAGDIGFHYLLQVLSDAHRDDVIYKVLERTELGSYRFIVDHGWTAMPEAWDATTAASMDHLMLGHIEQWFYENLMGLRQEHGSNGFKEIEIAPVEVGDLTSVEGFYDAPQGRIVVRWKRDGKKFTLETTIPVGVDATVVLPAPKKARVTESGMVITGGGWHPFSKKARGVRVVGRDGQHVRLAVGAGTYHFEVEGK